MIRDDSGIRQTPPATMVLIPSNFVGSQTLKPRPNQNLVSRRISWLHLNHIIAWVIPIDFWNNPCGFLQKCLSRAVMLWGCHWFPEFRRSLRHLGRLHRLRLLRLLHWDLGDLGELRHFVVVCFLRRLGGETCDLCSKNQKGFGNNGIRCNE